MKSLLHCLIFSNLILISGRAWSEDGHYFQVERGFQLNVLFEDPSSPTGTSKSAKVIKFPAGEVLAIDANHKIAIITAEKKTVYIQFPDSLFNDGFISPSKDSGSLLNEDDHVIFKAQPSGPGGGQKIPFFESTSPGYALFYPNPPMRDLSSARPSAFLTPAVRVKNTLLFDIHGPSYGEPDYKTVSYVCYDDVHMNKEVCGWTPASNLKNIRDPQGPAQELAPTPGPMIGSGPKGSSLPPPSCGLKKPTDVIKDLCGPIEDASNPQNALEKEVAKSLGACSHGNSKHVYTWDNGNLFDQYLKKSVDENYLRSKASSLIKDDGQRLTQSDFEDLDVLARTLLGEMETCDINYMRAAARTVLNRAEQAKTDLATGLGHSQYVQTQAVSQTDGLISRVCLARTQYDAWDDTPQKIRSAQGTERKEIIEEDRELKREIAREHKPMTPKKLELAEEKIMKEIDATEHDKVRQEIERMLCPKADARNLVAWQKAVSVALETVLHPNRLKAETKEMSASSQHEAYKFYTSNFKANPLIYGELPPPTVRGERLENKACMEFWELLTPAERKLRSEELKSNRNHRRK